MAAAASTSAPSSSSSKTVHTLETFRPLLKRLILAQPIPGVPSSSSHAVSQQHSQLSPADLDLLFEHLSDVEFTSNHAHQAPLGSTLTGLRLAGLDIRPETLLVASERFLSKSIPVDSCDGSNSLQAAEEVKRRLQDEPRWSEQADVSELVARWTAYDGTLDLVGTGGDGQDTFNVSTTAAIVASGVPGVRVCKHGAKASSSTSGSADLLLSLGIPLLSLTPSVISTLLPSSPFCFLFAQLFHPSLAPLGPIRRALGHPTIFNVLGPLVNPAKPKRCILGVHSAYLGQIFAEALKKRGCQRAWVVCGREGLDEISIEGETDVWQLDDGVVTHLTLSPSDFGLRSHPLRNVASYSSAENAAIVMHMLGADASSSQDDEFEAKLISSLPPLPLDVDVEAIRDYTLLQTSALLFVGGYATDYVEATRLARVSMTSSGGARQALRTFRTLSVAAVNKADEEAARAKKAEVEAQAQDTEVRRLRDARERKDAKDSLMDVRKDEYFYAPEPVRSVGVGTDD